MKKSFHAGAFFEAIGEDFSTLDRAGEVINADVLDAWFDPSPKVLEKIKAFLPFIARTSPPNYSEGLIRTISAVRGIPENNIIAAGGSSDLIFAFFHLFVNAGDRIILLDPTYGEYAYIASIVGADVHRFVLEKEADFRIDLPKLKNFIDLIGPAFIVIVNPNSPTGQYVSREALRTLIRSLPPTIKIIVDETYIEYVGRSESMEKDIDEFSNLIIIKSMSKVYALSGLRAGYIVANEDVIDSLSAIIPPWAVSLPAQIAAIEALNDEPYYLAKYIETHALREECRAALSSIASFHTYPSVANFFLIELKDSPGAQQVCDELKKQRIYIRNADSMGSKFDGNFLRIAVKSQPLNAKVLSALMQVCGKPIDR